MCGKRKALCQMLFIVMRVCYTVGVLKGAAGNSVWKIRHGAETFLSCIQGQGGKA